MPRTSREMMVPDRPLTTGDVARYCHTTVMQVNRWINQGLLKSFRSPGGQHRIVQTDFRDFLQRTGMPVMEDFFEPVATTRRILVVDDDRTLAQAICHLLRAEFAGYPIDFAAEGYEGLIKAGAFKPDLLILDIRMPKLDGLEVCERLRQNAATPRGLKILAITGHADAYNRETVLAHGADDSLLKPFDGATLVQKVRELLP